MKEFNLIETSFLLKKTSLFKEVDLDMLVSIADKAHQDIYQAGEKVFSQGDKAYRLYIIAKGSVGIFHPSETQICTLIDTDFFGDESLFNEDTRAYDAVCFSETLFITISKPLLMNIISESPQVAIALLETFAQNHPCRLKKKF